MQIANQRKKYIGMPSQNFVKAGWNVCDISNNALIFDTEKDHAMGLARAYNHQYCLPNKPLKYIAMNFIQVFESIQQTGGASYNIHTGELNPREGYMVALEGYEKRVALPASLNEFQNVVTAYLLEFPQVWKDEAKNIFLGFWIYENKLTIDFSENMDSIGEAYIAAVERSQIGVYDCKAKTTLKVIGFTQMNRA